MACEYCNGEGYHLPGCPSYSYPNHYFFCSICNEAIIDGEEYIENDNGDYAHWDCLEYGRELIKWLGHEIKTMENNYD